MRYFVHSLRMLLRSAMQYRASFVLQTIGQLIMTAGDLLAVLVLMDRFAHLGEWQPEQILFFFGVMQVCFSLVECFGRGISTFVSLIRSGDFDTFLLRPRPLIIQVMYSRLDPRRIGSVAVGLTALAVACVRLRLVWTAQKVLLMLVSVAGSVLLLMGLFLVEATFSFFSTQSIEMVNVLTYGGRQACQYPMDVYPGPLRLLFTWVAPFSLCMHLPVSFVLGRPLWSIPTPLIFAAPLSGALFFLVMVRLWYVGARHYRSTGS